MSWRKAARARIGKVGARDRHLLGDGDAECRNPLAVALGLRVLQVQGASQGLQRVVVGLFELFDGAGKLRGALFHKLLEVALVAAVFND